MINFAYTIIYVVDVEKTILFYEKAFGFERKFITPEGEYGELNTGTTTLSFAATSLTGSTLPAEFVTATASEKPLGVEVAFATSDVEGTYDNAIQAGATAVSAPKAKPWGQIVAYVRDINGFLIEICTPMS